MRTDSLYLGNTDIRVSSLLGALCFILLMPLLIAGRVRYAKLAKAGAIEKGTPADLPVLLGIVKPVQNEEKIEEKAEEAPLEAELETELNINKENAENGDMEE